MAFKRASLSGSAQLFQPTKVPARESSGEEHELGQPAELFPEPREFEPSLVTDAIPQPSAHGHLYRLTDDEVDTLVAALQHAKFPHSYQRLPKPPLEEFEQLEALRQKLVQQREERP
ncbi:MAG: hypothetical protein M0027_12460 [Candidatus Dormibacteraeota bacterium]|jgi:hypothetical protein|nr:hypothetical protein [Candidatus Dormibacteraeota bacterium]